MRKEDCFYLGKIAKNLVSKGSSCLFRHGWTWVIQKLGISVCWIQTLGSFKLVKYTKRFS
jgi:hypothetical protein